MHSTRRDWFSSCLAMTAVPAVLAAQQHAHKAIQSPGIAFENLDAETAGEIAAVSAQIIPSTNGPGAREAGVVYFIDRALSTFALHDRETYRSGIAELQEKRKELYPASTTIASLTNQQQIALMRSIEKSSFFELLRTHTVLGFLGDPSHGGNRGKVGWRQIGFDDRMAWQPPFGYYDAENQSREPGN